MDRVVTLDNDDDNDEPQEGEEREEGDDDGWAMPRPDRSRTKRRIAPRCGRPGPPELLDAAPHDEELMSDLLAEV